MRDADIPALVALMRRALEGARIAYGFGVSQQSRDALKTLSDLRKAVTDETSRLSDATRAMVAAVTTSAVGNVGLIIARVTLGEDAKFVAPAAFAIGIALAIYVGVVVWSAWHFLNIQSDLRRDWRDRLYRFLADDEYQRMVVDPVASAERGFKRAAVASGLITLLLLIAVVLVAVRSA
jgi:predicted permease